MNAPRGILLAVCGIGRGADSAGVSRLLAAELTRYSPPGAVLLTASRGPQATATLRRALERRSIVVADVGDLDADALDALSTAALVVCTFRSDGEVAAVAEALIQHRLSAGASVRWVAAVTSSEDTAPGSLARRIAPALPLSIRAVTVLPSPRPAADREAYPQPSVVALTSTLA